MECSEQLYTIKCVCVCVCLCLCLCAEVRGGYSERSQNGSHCGRSWMLGWKVGIWFVCKKSQWFLRRRRGQIPVFRRGLVSVWRFEDWLSFPQFRVSLCGFINSWLHFCVFKILFLCALVYKVTFKKIFGKKYQENLDHENSKSYWTYKGTTF